MGRPRGVSPRCQHALLCRSFLCYCVNCRILERGGCFFVAWAGGGPKVKENEMESVSDAASNGGSFANGEISKFLENVEELTKALKDVDAPDIARLRAKVKIALLAARGAVQDTAVQLRVQAQQVGQRTDSFVRDNPWQVVGIAAKLDGGVLHGTPGRQQRDFD